MGSMSHGLSVTPQGRLVLGHSAAEASQPSEEFEQRLAEALGQSNARGLLLLAGQGVPAGLPPELAFWRAFARRLLTGLCSLGESDESAWRELPPPADEELEQLGADAPPMRGLEYVNAELLRGLWNELRDLCVQEAASRPRGRADFLRQVDPLFHQLGRVTFHLAENKRDPSRPFAFLATFTHRVSEQARLAHLPLADALRTYVGARDKTKLKSLLAPVERAAERSSLVRGLLDSKALFAPQAWSISQAHRFLQEAPGMEAAGVVVRVPDWWRARRMARAQVQVRLGAREPSGLGLESMLDFNVGVVVDGEPLTEAERRQLLNATEGLTLLRGKWVEVDRDRLQQALDHWTELEQQHANGIDFIQGMRMLAGAEVSPADAQLETAHEWSQVVAGDWLRDALEQMRNPQPDRACQPGRDLQATLRPYQVQGVRWLWFMTQLGLGACLADDMGLGKTIQVIDLLLQRKRVARQPTPSLLVVPASLLGNWRQELQRFAPSLNVCILHRSECDAETLERVSKHPTRELARCDLAITSYGLVRRQPWLGDVRWSLVVLDEAQAIKNAGTSQTRSVKQLRASSRLVLTGTPVENNLGDLWSLFDFACPGLLGSGGDFKRFVKRLNTQGESQSYAALRRLVRPYILRRMKTDPNIVPDLPDKTELRAECGLSKKQAVLYERAVKELAERLQESEGIQRRGLVLTTLMQLKQICNHPSQYLGDGKYDSADSAKFDRIRLLCEPIVERQERALVFTQFQTLTEPLAAFLATVFGRAGLVLHGGTAIKKRSELVNLFQSADGPPFFVISLKAGGSGLNLTAASHVIHFDRWWNPAVENQATDRAFRIGQKRNVLVHKFVCRGTVEERIDKMLSEKQSVADQILGPEDAPALTEMSDEELLGFVALDLQRALEDE